MCVCVCVCMCMRACMQACVPLCMGMYACVCKVSSAHDFVICSEYIGTTLQAQYFPRKQNECLNTHTHTHTTYKLTLVQMSGNASSQGHDPCCLSADQHCPDPVSLCTAVDQYTPTRHHTQAEKVLMGCLFDQQDSQQKKIYTKFTTLNKQPHTVC